MPKIISHKKVNSCYYKIIIQAPQISRKAKPGQFLNIRVNNGYDPLLRRPFSIHRVDDKNIEIIYEVLGRGTEILSQRKTGEDLDVIGPLGNGFNYQLPITNYQLPILVAGGMGVAPFLFLAEKLIDHRPQTTDHRPIMLIGAKTKTQILCEKEFKDLGYEVKISTEDGSEGFRGKVTDLLKNLLLTTHNSQLTTIYACGPRPMLKEIARISQKYNIPAQVSLEEHMACGIGACLGCVIKIKNQKSTLRLRSGLMVSGPSTRFTRSGSSRAEPRDEVEPSKIKNDFVYKRACKEGPVFDADEIVW